MTFNFFRFALAASILLLMSITVPAIAEPVKNIVLVHGAWVNGSGWKPVFEILVKDGYHVSVAEHPFRIDAGRALARRLVSQVG
jgi:hypothetical protein